MSSTANSVPPYVFESKGTFPAPFTFDVPASLEVRPDTATARFDGSGASGDFLACLTFYGSDGERLGRWFNPTVLHEGDVAEVTYTPPFGSAATSAASAAAPLSYGIYEASPTVPANNLVDGIDFSAGLVEGTEQFSYPSTPGTFKILESGVYAITIYVTWSSGTVTPGSTFTAYFQYQSTPVPEQYNITNQAPNGFAPNSGLPDLNGTALVTAVVPLTLDPFTYGLVALLNNDTANAQTYFVKMIVVNLGTFAP